MSVRYLLLHRAIRNAGDFLIRQRATELISEARPDAELVSGEGWRPLDEQFGQDLERFDAIIVSGGPGFQRRMYPRIYPLVPLERIGVPLVLLSMGSYFFPADAASIDAHQLDSDTVRFLRWVAARAPAISTRDRLSATLLERAGIPCVRMTGDVAWYSSRNVRLTPPADIDRIAFTPPANPLFYRDGLDVLAALRREFPRAHLLIALHRDPQPPFERAARKLSAEVVNLAGSVEGFETYDAVSLHVGYRLHAHLYRLSHGRPSYLLAEDSRGVGALQTLGPLGVDPFGVHRRGRHVSAAWSALPRIGNPSRLATRTIGMLAGSLMRYGDPSRPLLEQLSRDTADGFARHELALQQISMTRGTMDSVLDALP